MRGTSLIIATYNWEAALDRVLASVQSQQVPPNEVIIADDGSTSPTRDVVERWTKKLRIPTRHVWQEDRGFRLAAIRNRAFAVAGYDYVLMIDGDMILHEQFVADHIAFARPGTYVQGSRVMIREAATRRILSGDSVSLHPLARGIGNRVNAIRLPSLSRLFRGASGPIKRTRGANMAYWLSDVRRVNGFNEDIEGWGYEDIEFVARLQNAGVARRNLKFAAVAYHLHHRTKPINPHANREFFERVTREKLTWCANGLDKYTDPHSGGGVTASARSNG